MYVSNLYGLEAMLILGEHQNLFYSKIQTKEFPLFYAFFLKFRLPYIS